MDSCFQCGAVNIKSAKRDFPICSTCFTLVAAEEKRSVRRLRFEPADHVLDNLYLGPEGSATDLQWLKEHNIDRIVIAAQFCEKHLEAGGIEYMVLDIDDSPTETIRPHFEAVFDFIKKRPTNVLVHCVSGISRSGCLTIAYAMKERGLGFDAAWQFVRTKRACVHPNSGFQAQLRAFEDEIRAAATPSN